MLLFKKFTNRDAEHVAVMIEKMIQNYIDLDGRIFITNHDTETTRADICKHYAILQDECTTFARKYESILDKADLYIVIDDVIELVKMGRRLMLDLYDDDLDNIDVLIRAIKRGNKYEF